LSSKSTFSNSTSKSYALALYELSKESSELDKIEEEMKSLENLLKESSDFKEMILNPTIPKEDKANVISSLAGQNNFSKILKNFLGFVAIKNRLFYLSNIVESFLNLVSNNKGELKAKLTSSRELSLNEQQKIQSELSKDFKSKLNLDYKYEPSLIAGLIIQVGSIMIDTSIKTKLKKLEKNMLEA
jgi:F-type H+-transporting ATPase subunit delta